MTTLSDMTRNALAAAGPSTVSVGRHGRGAGVVVGHNRVLTNAHNLRDRTTQVMFTDGRAVQGRVSGSAPDHDVVVIDVDTGDVPAIEWSESAADVGDFVFAIGRSRWGDRVTAGQVSSVGQRFRGPRGRRVTGALEHTAPLARGSSGGPLVDESGRLVGVNTHRLGDGFYLALPADAELKQRVDALASGTSFHGRRMGIAVTPAHVARRLRRRVGLPERDGLLVSGVVDGSPAHDAGISDGDLIVGVDGTDITSVDELWDALDNAGDEVTLQLVRGTDEREATLTFSSDTPDKSDDDSESGDTDEA